MKHCYELLNHHTTADPFLRLQMCFSPVPFSFSRKQSAVWFVCVAVARVQHLTKDTSLTLMHQLTLSHTLQFTLTSNLLFFLSKGIHSVFKVKSDCLLVSKNIRLLAHFNVCSIIMLFRITSAMINQKYSQIYIILH